jgi:O-acetyl-ADP-ribose deacetylase (regulator of RNase III)
MVDGIPPTVQYDIGSRTLEVVYGDLVSITADVLVSSDDNYLTMGGGVSAGILRAGGDAVREHAGKFVPSHRTSPLRRGDVVVTTAGRLPSKFIFHAVMIDHDAGQRPTVDTIREATSRAMVLADGLQVGSIAFPALGTGVGGFPFNIAADAMVRTIVEHLDRASHVERVSIALRARAGVVEADLNTFYAASVGLIAQWEQAKRLRTAVDRLGDDAASRGKADDSDRLSTLSDDVESLLADLASTPATVAVVRDESRSRKVTELATRALDASERVSAFRGDSPQAVTTQLEALRLHLAAARHRLGGLESQRAYGTDTPESREELDATAREISDLHSRIADLAPITQPH